MGDKECHWCHRVLGKIEKQLRFQLAFRNFITQTAFGLCAGHVCRACMQLKLLSSRNACKITRWICYTDSSHSVSSNSSNLSAQNSAIRMRKMMIYVNSCLLVLWQQWNLVSVFLLSLPLAVSRLSLLFPLIVVGLYGLKTHRTRFQSIRKSENNVKILFAIFRPSTRFFRRLSVFPLCRAWLGRALLGLASFCSTSFSWTCSSLIFLYSNSNMYRVVVGPQPPSPSPPPSSSQRRSDAA